jgi:hypothetical protein
MNKWQGALLFVWCELIAVALPFAHIAAFRNPSRNRGAGEAMKPAIAACRVP